MRQMTDDTEVWFVVEKDGAHRGTPDELFSLLQSRYRRERNRDDGWLRVAYRAYRADDYVELESGESLPDVLKATHTYALDELGRLWRRADDDEFSQFSFWEEDDDFWAARRAGEL